jgi:replicative DNA helicase
MRSDYSLPESAPEMVEVEEKQVPFDAYAEKCLLGAVLLDNQAFYEITEDGLGQDDFFLDSHRKVFVAMTVLMGEGRQVDVVTIPAHLGSALQSLGGMAFLFSLTEDLPRRPKVSEYLRIVRDKSLARKAMAVASEMAAAASAGGEDALSTVQKAVEALEGFSARSVRSGFEVVDVIADEASKFEREADSPSGGLMGCSMLTPEVDRVTCGLMEEELCILAGRPGQGKTEAGLQIALKNARRGKRIHIQSLEMRRTQLIRRLWRLIARVPVSAMRDPRCLNPDQRQAIRNAQEELADLPIFIDETHELTVQAFRSKAVLAAKRWKADLIIVDYAQLLLVPRSRSIIESAPKQAETLRHIARDYCRTVALAQLRRTPPNDLNRYPDIEDLLGSSAFEQAAQMILMLHRTRENKLYTGEDFCFLGKMRELQQLQPFGIKAERWGEFTDRYDENHQSHWTDKE